MSIAFTTLPIPTRKHQVGTIRYDLTDLYRKDLHFPQGRLIPIQISFPKTGNRGQNRGQA